jgi:predicted RNase H-like nuclease (RuvC/YqgF family)
MAQAPETHTAHERRIAALEDELKQRDRRITELEHKLQQRDRRSTKKISYEDEIEEEEVAIDDVKEEVGMSASDGGRRGRGDVPSMYAPGTEASVR